jgi:hypothetical protein
LGVSHWRKAGLAGRRLRAGSSHGQGGTEVWRRDSRAWEVIAEQWLHGCALAGEGSACGDSLPAVSVRWKLC